MSCSPDMHTYVCVTGGKNLSFSGHFVYVLNERFHMWPCLVRIVEDKV